MPPEKKDSRFKTVALTAAIWLAVPSLFGLTVYSIWLDRAASAAVAGAFSLAFVILRQLPLIERFKIFTLEATFAKRVDEAQRLLDNIRETAEIHSRLLYWQVGKGDRMSHMPWALKRSLIGEFDGLLLRLGLPQAEVKSLKEPFLHTIKLDLFRVYENAVDNRVRLHRNELQSRVSAFPKPIRADDPNYLALVEESRAMKLPFETTRDVMDDGRLDDMSSITAKLIEATPLPQHEKEKLEVVRGEVIQHAAECERAGNVTQETEDYLNRYSRNTNARAEELFA